MEEEPSSTTKRGPTPRTGPTTFPEKEKNSRDDDLETRTATEPSKAPEHTKALAASKVGSGGEPPPPPKQELRRRQERTTKLTTFDRECVCTEMEMEETTTTVMMTHPMMTSRPWKMGPVTMMRGQQVRKPRSISILVRLTMTRKQVKDSNRLMRARVMHILLKEMQTSNQNYENFKN